MKRGQKVTQINIRCLIENAVNEWLLYLNKVEYHYTYFDYYGTDLMKYAPYSSR